jgi:3-oxoacyl-[acyl-carrier protein] reductase
LEFSKKKIRLFLVSRNLNNLKKLKKEISKKFNFNNVEIIQGDVSSESNLKKIEKICKKSFGLPDILINNTGGPPSGNFTKFNNKVWEKNIKNNLMSVINFTNMFHKKMIKNKWGRIITISSTVAKEPSSNMVISSTLRSGVSGFNKSISFELAKNNITVNTILLGGVKTDRLKELIKKNSKSRKIKYETYLNQVQKSIPAGRFAEPEEISNLVNFLISEHGSYITGQNIVIDGGLSKSL